MVREETNNNCNFESSLEGVIPFAQLPSGVHFRIAPNPRKLWFKCAHGISVDDDTFKMIIFKDDAPCIAEV